MQSMRYIGALLVLVCLGFSAWVGAIYGAGRGGLQYDARFAPTEAFDTTMILRLLRKGQVDEAIAHLESKVDLELDMANFYDSSFDRWMGSPGAKAENLENRAKLLKLVEKYQTEFPYDSSFDRIRRGAQAVGQTSPP